MKRIIVLSLMIILLIVAAASTAVFAWFTAEFAAPIETVITAGSEQQIVLIDTEYALRQHAFDKYSNSALPVSDIAGGEHSGRRQSLKLTEDVELEGDLTINRDISLDLNGCELKLNGYSLVFKHYYHGALVVRSGVISGGEVVYETPNALIDDNTVTFTLAQRTVLSQDEAMLAQRIFEYVESSFDDYYNTNIPLIKNYYNSGVNFNWVSDKPALVNHNGILVTPPVLAEAVSLTLTLSHQAFLQSTSRTFALTVIPPSDDALDYGEAELDAFFEQYMYGTQSIYFYHSAELPRKNAYYGLQYSYSTVNAEDLRDGWIIEKGSETRTITLYVEIKNADELTRTLSYTVNIVVENNLDITDRMVKAFDIYFVTNAQSYINLPLFSELSPYGVKQTPNYTFINNNNNYSVVHDAETGYDKIVVDALPETSDVIYIRMGFTFITNSPIYVETDVRIFYVDASGLDGEHGFDRYAYIYYLLDEKLAEKTGGATFKDFTMPSEFFGFGVEYSAPGAPAGAIGFVADADNTLFHFVMANVPVSDTLITVEYLFEGAERTYLSYFTLPGIINNNAEGIQDNSFYAAALSFYDDDEDGVLSREEAEAPMDCFVISEHTNNVVASYKGIDFFTSTFEYNFDGRGFSTADMVFVKTNGEITSLSMRDCGLADVDLGMFEGLNKLAELDIGNNGLTSLTALFIPNSVTTFRADANQIGSIDALTSFPMIQYLYIQNNPIRIFKGLLDMTSLKEVYLYNETYPTIDDYYGAKGRYNTSIYIFMDNKSIKVYNDYNGTAVQFAYHPDEAAAAAILESMFYYSYSQSEFTVPIWIYYTSADFYVITWDFSNLSSVSTQTADGLAQVTHASSAATYEIYASTTVGTHQVYRILYIEVQP
ncbi:MAG: hypothetical protein PHC84_02820 [Clostridia bacterium]|nr:hypothetical protein [Clostridia bacterium]